MQCMQWMACVVGVLCMLATGVATAGAADLLIAYYSRTGNTAVVCTALAADIGADLVEIEDLHSRES